jgi:hypothetical protein
LFPFVEDKSTWIYPQDIMYWEDWPAKQAFLLFGGLHFENQNYINIWLKLPEDSEVDEIQRNTIVRYPLIWLNGKTGK